MKHYEIILLVHPDQSSQVPAMVERYTDIIKKYDGKVDRVEDWGRRKLAYPIQKVYKAHYILMNVTVKYEAIAELEGLFRYNDAVIRNLILNTSKSESDHTPLYKAKIEKDKRQNKRDDKPSGSARVQEKADTAKADTAKVDTAKADTAKVDTAKTDTAKADTAKADTAKAEIEEH